MAFACQFTARRLLLLMPSHESIDFDHCAETEGWQPASTLLLVSLQASSVFAVRVARLHRSSIVLQSSRLSNKSEVDLVCRFAQT